MTHSLNYSEQQALLGSNNIQGKHFRSPYYSGVMLEQPLNASDVDTTTSVGVFKSRSVVQQPSEDFFHEGIPIWRAALLVVNAALGAGILNFPQAYAECGGIATAIVIQMSLLVFITGAFLILAYCADKHGSQNFQEVIREVLGPGAYIVTQIFVLLYMFGSTIAYMILIGDQLQSVGKAIDSEPPWYLSRIFLMCAVCIIFLLPLCLPKTLKVLSYSSALGTIGAIFICVVTATKYFQGNYTVNTESVQVQLPWTEAFSAVPIICFGFQCHVPSIAVYAELKRASVPRFGIVVVIAMAICAAAYAITGSFGYLTFGTKVKSDVLLNYHPNDVLVNCARVTLSIIVLSTGAVVVFCGRSCLEGLYLSFFRMPPALAEVHERKRRIIQTIVWFSLSLIVSVFVKDIGYAVALIGGLAALFIFFFPGICLVQEMLQYPVLSTTKKLLIALGLFYVVLGVFIFADSEVFAIMKDITGKGLY
ncbi:hypothetical protein ABFA07_011802 [Porites harrisoni]